MLRLVRSGHDGSGPRSPVAEQLTGVHDRWLVRFRDFIGRILANDAGLMDRWGALRELDEEFSRWYGGELALVRYLAPALPPGAEHRLARAEEAIGNIRAEIARFVPTSETTAPLREAVLDLLDAVQLWCAELELAVAELPSAELGGGQAVLRRLDLSW